MNIESIAIGLEHAADLLVRYETVRDNLYKEMYANKQIPEEIVESMDDVSMYGSNHLIELSEKISCIKENEDE